MTQAPRGRFHPQFREHTDSIGLGKITENQLKGVTDLVKARGLLKTPPPEPTGDRGVVIAAGGRYADYGWANARWLRHKGIQHPIQIWYLGPTEFPRWAERAFKRLDVELVDALKVRETHWHRSLKGWFLKEYAMMHAPFEEVVFYDADCFAICDPSKVWDDPEYQDKAALFFSDVKPCRSADWHYVSASVRVPDKEAESGCFFWNRHKAWYGIKMVNWFCEHHDAWTKFTHGDKELIYLGLATTETPYIQSMECEWAGHGIRQSWKGRVICEHQMAAKRKEHAFHDPVIPGFFDEWRSMAP